MWADLQIKNFRLRVREVVLNQWDVETPNLRQIEHWHRGLCLRPLLTNLA